MPTHSLIYPNDSVSFWTMIVAIATIALVLMTLAVAVLGKRGPASVGPKRDDLRTRGIRDAQAAAGRRCQQFAEETIPANAEILAALKKENIPVFVTDVTAVRFDETDDPATVRAAVRWMEALSPDLQLRTLRLLNHLEVWAMPFAHELADHAIAFDPCARAYCQIVIQYFPCLLVARRENPAGKFRNLINVFDDWSRQLLAADKGRAALILLSEVRRYQMAGPGLRPPLGLGIENRQTK